MSCLIDVFFCLFFHSAAWSNMTDPWQNFSEAEFHIFLCTTIEIIIIYITSNVVSNVTRSIASDDLLYVNCNVTNQTQTCFQSTQVVHRLPGVWVLLLVLYWRPIYFVVFIVESLLGIFIYCLFCFRCSAVCFLHRRECCWLQIPLWYAVFNKVCEIILSEVLATQMGVMRCSIKVSSFEMHKFGPFSPHRWSIPRELVHSYVWVACELLQFAATQ